MPYSLDNKLVVAISSRALFDFEAENTVYEHEGEAVYEKFQLQRLEQPAHPGVAFALVQKLLAFNTTGQKRVEVVMLSKNDPVSGLRAFKSAEYHKLDISRGAFTRGESPFVYLKPLHAGLFLSADEKDVRCAIEAEIPAARVYTKLPDSLGDYPNQLRIALDGDSVLFSDEAERVFQADGLQQFLESEKEKANQPLSAGPFKPFLAALHELQKNPPTGVDMGIRTALVTARNTPAHERAIKTLMSWNIKIDEAFFLGGLDKGAFLGAFQPDFYFDDQISHCDSAAQVTATGHVDYGVANEPAHTDAAPDKLHPLVPNPSDLTGRVHSAKIRAHQIDISNRPSSTRASHAG